MGVASKNGRSQARCIAEIWTSEIAKKAEARAISPQRPDGDTSARERGRD